MKFLPAGQVWLILLIAFISSAAFAQDRKNDLIVKRDSSKISCTVLVVKDQTVQYKKTNDPDGPLFNILKSDIARIVYGNGDTEVFQETISRLAPDYQGAVILRPVAPWRSPGFVDNLSFWTSGELTNASNFYKSKARHSKIGSLIFMSVGVASTVTGIVLLSSLDRNRAYRSSADLEPGVGAIIGGVSAGIVGVLFSRVRVKGFRRNAAQVEEELSKRKLSLGQLRIGPTINPFSKSAALTLALRF